MKFRDRYVVWLKADGPREVVPNLVFSVCIGMCIVALSGLLLGVVGSVLVALWFTSPFLALSAVTALVLAVRFVVGAAREARR